ncbi:MAG TPA: hypothetical protein VD791_12765, partial [Burkholderiales bacterium]|nr:hypothetical protein [Burkholderiales bacterium]
MPPSQALSPRLATRWPALIGLAAVVLIGLGWWALVPEAERPAPLPAREPVSAAEPAALAQQLLDGARTDLSRGNAPQARALYRRAVAEYERSGDQAGMAAALEEFAALEYGAGH